MKKETKTPASKGTPKVYGPKPDMEGVKTSGIQTRGNGAAIKGTKARGPIA